MIKRNEVFHVSLVEIAFTLVLLLTMLLGTRLMSVHNKSVEQEEIISNQKEVIKNLELLTSNAGLCSPDPDDPISPMMPCNKCLSVVAHISKKDAMESIDLGRELTKILREINPDGNYESFKNELKKVAELVSKGKEVVDKDDLSSTVAQLESTQDNLASTVAQLESTQKNLNLAQNQIQELQEILQKENEDELTRIDLHKKIDSLQNQITKYEKDIQTIDTQNKYLARIAGLGYPPCWVGSNGKPQYLFSIDLLPDDKVIVNRAWPEERNQEALEMAPVRDVQKYFGEIIPLPRFLPYANQILDISNNAKPSACRHFVILKNHIPDRLTGDRQRLRIENSFYKLEVLTKEQPTNN